MPKGQITWNKGKKGIYSFEAIQKMSLARKGRVPWNKGKAGVYSEEYRKKISDAAKLRIGTKNSFYGKAHSLHNVLKHRAVASIPSIRMCLSCGRGFFKQKEEKFRYFATKKYCNVKCQWNNERTYGRRLRLPYRQKLCLEGCGRPAVRHRGKNAENLFASVECYHNFRRRRASF